MKQIQVVKMDYSIIKYFRVMLDFDNESEEYRKIIEKEFIEELTKSLNCGIGNKEIEWVNK